MEATGKGFVDAETKKLKYTKDGIEALLPVINDSVGKEVYVTIALCEDVDYSKEHYKYYIQFVLPQIHNVFKEKGYFKTPRQTHYFLLAKFGKKIITEIHKKEVLAVESVMPFEDMEPLEKINFIVESCLWATKEFGIHFKSVGDIQGVTK